MSQFRTNLVASGTRPFEEDSWVRIRIGEVEFQVVKPCSRCIMTTVEAGTDRFNALKEPLATLTRYRRGEDGEVYFGQNLVALNEGWIETGSEIEVLETTRPLSTPTPHRRSGSWSVWPAKRWRGIWRPSGSRRPMANRYPTTCRASICPSVSISNTSEFSGAIP